MSGDEVKVNKEEKKIPYRISKKEILIELERLSNADRTIYALAILESLKKNIERDINNEY